MNQKCMMPNMKLVENNNLKGFTVELLNKYLLTYNRIVQLCAYL